MSSDTLPISPLLPTQRQIEEQRRAEYQAARRDLLATERGLIAATRQRWPKEAGTAAVGETAVIVELNRLLTALLAGFEE